MGWEGCPALQREYLPPFPPPRNRLRKGCMDTVGVRYCNKMVVATNCHHRLHVTEAGESSDD